MPAPRQPQPIERQPVVDALCEDIGGVGDPHRRGAIEHRQVTVDLVNGREDRFVQRAPFGETLGRCLKLRQCPLGPALIVVGNALVGGDAQQRQ